MRTVPISSKELDNYAQASIEDRHSLHERLAAMVPNSPLLQAGPLQVQRYGQHDYILTTDLTLSERWTIQLRSQLLPEGGESVTLQKLLFHQYLPITSQQWLIHPEQRRSLSEALSSDWSTSEGRFTYRGQPLTWVYRLASLQEEDDEDSGDSEDSGGYWQDHQVFAEVSNPAEKFTDNQYLLAGEQTWRQRQWLRLINVRYYRQEWEVRYFLLNADLHCAYDLNLRDYRRHGYDCDFKRVWIDGDQLCGYRYYSWEGRRYPPHDPESLQAGLQEIRTTVFYEPDSDINGDDSHYRRSRQCGLFKLCPSLQQQFDIENFERILSSAISETTANPVDV